MKTKKQLKNSLKKTFLSFSFAFVTLSSLAQTNVFDNIINVSPDHTFLAAAITQENLQGALQNNAATLTVFAPTNAAIENLAALLGTDVAGVLELDILSDVLLYHVLNTTVPSGALSPGVNIVTPLNTENTIKVNLQAGGSVFVNHAQVTVPNLTADNGVVHVINEVILPIQTVIDIAINAGNFTTLTAAVVQQNLLPTLLNPHASFTVLAPNDAAFATLLTNLGATPEQLLADPNLTNYLLYHVFDDQIESGDLENGLLPEPLFIGNSLKVTLTGGDVFFNQAKVLAADLGADNGVVHVLENVLLPVETVVDVAIDNNFTYLTTALFQEGLVPALSDPFGTFTVFAPNNAAFDTLADDLNTDIAGLLALENLSSVLLYHVIGSVNESADLVNGNVPTLQGQSVAISIDGGVTVNNATVILADVTAANGVVHVIDAVLLPADESSIVNHSASNLNIYPNPSAATFSIDGVINADVRIVDVSGQVVQTAQYQGGQVNIDTLPSGIYFIHISNEQINTVNRLVKQ